MIRKVIFLILPLFLGEAFSDSLPLWYSSQFDAVGRINTIELAESRVVIADTLYRISPTLQVSTVLSEHDSSLNIRAGDRVRVQLKKGVHGYKIITHLWVMPPGVSLLPLP